MTRPKIERDFQRAVREAIAAKHAAGLPAFQGIDGYLVALYPDGRKVRLKKLITDYSWIDAYDGVAIDDSRRAQRGRQNDSC